MKRDCRKLQNKKTQSACIASTSDTSEHFVKISADKYAKFSQHMSCFLIHQVGH